MQIAFEAFPFGFISGKIIFIIGEKHFERKFVISDFSATFIIPVQNAMIPIMDVINLILSNVPEMTALERSLVFPVKNAQKILIKIIIAHM